MSEPTLTAPTGRLLAAGGWVVTIGVAAILVWTTLCLGGFLTETMLVSGPAVLLLAAIGAAWLAWRPRPLARGWWLPLPFLAYALASVLWVAPAAWLGWREWLLWFQMWLVFFLTLHFVRSRWQNRVLVAAIVGLGLAGVAMAAYQRYLNPTWLMLGRVQAEQYGQRSAGMFGIPNSLAGLLELLLPVCLLLPASRAVRPHTKVICLWLGALFLFGLILTGSRGGWLALSGALLLWPMFDGGGWRRRLVGAGLVLAVLCGGMAALYRFSPPVHDRLTPFLRGEFESSRPIIWRGALALWREQPWFGTGAASFNVLYETQRPRGFLNEPIWTHNDYLNTLGDYGVLGFALWFLAGAGLLAMGWRTVRQARLRSQGGEFFRLWKWKLGLWLGLVAFAFHLSVDFHTKIPALAYLAAVVAGLLLQSTGEVEQQAPPRLVSRLLAGVIGLALLGLAAGKALPLYRAEGVRYAARREINLHAVGGGDQHRTVIMAALPRLRASVETDPGNGQAWSDLAYAISQSWSYTGGNLPATGREAFVAAERAVTLCPRLAEFWIRRGVAQDMMGDTSGADLSFTKASMLAPNNPEWRYYQAYHLAAVPGKEAEARRAVETCLSLDPSYLPAIGLRERLQARSH